MARSRRANGAPVNPVRSVRVEDGIWNKAVRRAERENRTISEVLLLFVTGYAEGLIPSPRVQVVYGTPAAATPSAAPATPST